MVNLINCSLKDFLERMQYKRILAFGAGRKLVPFVKRHMLSTKIQYVIDNDTLKTGSSIDFGDSCSVPVIGINDLDNKKINKKEIVLLISSVLSAGDILELLDNTHEFDGVDCYICSLMEEQYSYQKIVFGGKKEKIPRIIHYAWFGSKELPLKFQKNIDTWHRYCPDYEIIRWDDTNYDVTQNDYMLEAYEAKKWGFVPDYLRLDVIYKYGGIYLDTDVEMVCSFDDLLDDDCFMGYFDSNVVALGLGFGAVKGSNLICELRNIYNSKHFINLDGSYNMTTCVEYQYGVLKEYGFAMNGKYEIINRNVLYPMDVFNPLGKSGVCNCKTDNTHSIHRAEISYETSETRTRYRKGINYLKKRMENY